jgi:5-formyltetrahydrofolate cyclo-ligase
MTMTAMPIKQGLNTAPAVGQVAPRKQTGCACPGAAQLTKKMMRSTMLTILNNQKEEDRKRKSGKIKKKLLNLKSFQKAKTVMFYIALRGEVDTDEMIRAAIELGKIVTVPVCLADRVTIQPCMLGHATRFRLGPYGVREPVENHPVPPADLDAVIVPGVAFDKKGNRLGRGKGCYDRFLRTLPKEAVSIGVAFDFQVLPSVPTAEHDETVHKLIFA